MHPLIIASTRPYIGKSGIALALLAILAERGHATAYFKPYGTMPATIDGVQTDLDAAYISTRTTLRRPLDVVCPVVATTTLFENVIAGQAGDLQTRARDAFSTVADGADIVVVEGPSDLSQGRSVDLSLPQVAELVDGRVLLIAAGESVSLPDAVLSAADVLGTRLAGVLFNDVTPRAADFAKRDSAGFLQHSGVTVFGSVPHDSMLSSVTVAEVVDELSATVLSAEQSLGTRAESFMVGAMGQDKALRFFRKRPRKIVVTGGDRSDVQLAALETDTTALVLTGDLAPSPHVLARAEELGVPVIIVREDTLSTVARLERMFGRVRLHDPVKAARIREMLTSSVDVDAMLEALLRR